MGPVATKLAKELRKVNLGAVRDLAEMREAKKLQETMMHRRSRMASRRTTLPG